jgi:dienelactone hydrolase
MTVVAIALPYAKAHLIARISVDGHGQIAGFLVQPAPRPTTAPDAGAKADAPYVERDTTVGEGERALPGTLAMPKVALTERVPAPRPVPAVVLVHGSGPQDRDETIGQNHPFRDIARGLAAQGIAVLRYDKRTKARPQDFAGRDFDADDEVTDDAVMAIESLRATDGIDPNRIYVLGHSLGGMLAPRIARASGHVAGLVLMAPPARPVLDLLLEQSERQAARDGTVSADERATLDDLQARIDRVRAAGVVLPTDTPMGLPAAYWRSLERIDPVADARALTQPILVIHGGRDIQVVEADRQRWQEHLSTQPNVHLRHYRALNHLGIAGDGPGTVEEYFVPGSVDVGLINDIALWIRNH